MTTSAPRPLPADATDAGLAFHRLVFARRRRGWWTPLVTGLLALAFYLAISVVLTLAMIVWALVDPTFADSLLTLDVEVSFDITDPALMAVVLGSIALMLPAYLAASRIINGPRLGLVSSAAGRLRWRWMLWCALWAVVVFVVGSGVSMLLPASGGDASGVVSPAENPNFWLMLIVLIVLVPLQAAAEEYVFRGYLQQAVGRWLRHPLFAILLPVPLFVLGHLYDLPGQIAVGIFAVAAGWMTWRTGGLEAAIALHVVNNLSSFVLALFGGADVNAQGGYDSTVFSALVIGAYCVIVEVAVRRRRLPRTLVLTPPPAPVDPYAATSSASRIV